MNNTKFIELINKAGLKSELWNNPDPVSDRQPFLIYKEDPLNPGGLEKFAELIIAECVKVANDNFNSGFCPVGDFIKEHFDMVEYENNITVDTSD